MLITAIIPARSGSKRIRNKNIKLYNQHPLIYWSIKIAQQSKYINRIIVDTDSPTIADIAKSYGAEVLYYRPANISDDLNTDYEFIIYHLQWLMNKGESIPELIIQLRPTYPNRKIEIVDHCIELFLNIKNQYSALRSICKMDKPAYKMYNIINNQLVPLFQSVNGINEPYNMPAQLLPCTYWHNGYIDIIKPSTVFQGSITGDYIYPYLMEQSEIDDIDTEEDWIKSEKNSYPLCV